MRFNVTVEDVQLKAKIRKRQLEDGAMVEEEHTGRVVQCKASKGGKVFFVGLYLEDPTPEVGAKMALHWSKGRARLIER